LHRSITPREAARIQSFSDNYIFYGNKTSVCKQIGNAVPPLLALALGKAILKSLKK
ncbi:DNA cytosine methyltransferase, partial [Helicobacter pylori]